MNIGFDLDNTLVNLSTVNTVSKKLGYIYTTEDTTSYDLTCFPSDMRIELQKMWSNKDHMCSLELFDGVKDILINLKANGHKLHLITARADNIKKSTLEFINYILPDIFETIHVENNKLPLLKALNIDLWVDDSPYDCIKTTVNNINTIMVSNLNTKYNWYVKEQKTLLKIHPTIGHMSIEVPNTMKYIESVQELLISVPILERNKL